MQTTRPEERRIPGLLHTNRPESSVGPRGVPAEAPAVVERRLSLPASQVRSREDDSSDRNRAGNPIEPGRLTSP
jgi:hypothetical protein